MISGIWISRRIGWKCYLPRNPDAARNATLPHGLILQLRSHWAYKGFAAIRTVSTKLFTIFGLGQWLRHERDKASARRRKAQRKADAAGLAKLGLLINGASNGKARPAAKAGTTENRTLKLKELMAADPDRPIEELFELLRAPP